jgi:hypothetical protein
MAIDVSDIRLDKMALIENGDLPEPIQAQANSANPVDR